MCPSQPSVHPTCIGRYLLMDCHWRACQRTGLTIVVPSSSVIVVVLRQEWWLCSINPVVPYTVLNSNAKLSSFPPQHITQQNHYCHYVHFLGHPKNYEFDKYLFWSHLQDYIILIFPTSASTFQRQELIIGSTTILTNCTATWAESHACLSWSSIMKHTWYNTSDGFKTNIYEMPLSL